ncbi:PEPxxWA-CTERM sorting domain-containing protein [Sphingomonas sp. LMO-1]
MPETSTWAMMILGFGTVGIVMRGRKMMPRQAA